MKCPYCMAKLGFFVEWHGQRRVKNSACPNCGGKVSMAFNVKRFAILLPIVIALTVAGWHTVAPDLLALLSATAIFFGTVQLEKAPDV